MTVGGRTERAPELTSASDLAERLRASLEAEDWPQLRALYHPDARIATVLSGRDPLTADESIAAIRSAVEAGTYTSDWFCMHDLDELAVVTVGDVTTGPPRQTVRDVCWVSTFRDGLVYRTAVFDSVPDAYGAYRTLGVELGMS